MGREQEENGGSFFTFIHIFFPFFSPSHDKMRKELKKKMKPKKENNIILLEKGEGDKIILIVIKVVVMFYLSLYMNSL